MNLESIYFKLTDRKNGHSLQQKEQNESGIRENDDVGNYSKQVIDNMTYSELNNKNGG